MNHSNWRHLRPTLAIAETLAAILAASPLWAAPPRQAQGAQPPVEALIYSTMASRWEHRPTMAMDGDPNTYFESTGGMDDGDDFLVLLSRAVPVESIRVATGDLEANDALNDAVLEVSSDASTYARAASFDKAGVADADLHGHPVSAVRIRMNRRAYAPKLAIREISIRSSMPISHVQYGPGRGFVRPKPGAGFG